MPERRTDGVVREFEHQAVIVRAPLLPISRILSFTEDLEAPAAPPHELTPSIERDRARLRERLAQWVANPVVREALYFASPRLLRALPAWTRDPDSKEGRDVERSLHRYFYRMCCRSTPFGLFAGVSVGSIGGPDSLRLGAELRRYVALDSDFVYRIADRLGREDDGWTSTKLYTNSTLVPVGSELRYVEATGRGSGKQYSLASVSTDEILPRVVAAAEHGSTPDALAALICELDDELPRDSALAFVKDLHDADILQSGLSPEITGRRPTESLRCALQERNDARASAIAAAEASLRALDQAPLGGAPEHYESIQRGVEEALHIEAPRHPFYAQLIRSGGELRVSEETLNRVLDVAHTLRCLKPPDDPLATFASSFRSRYGEGDAWVSLPEVLDEDSGIGFGRTGIDPSPLLAGLPTRPARDPDAGAGGISVRPEVLGVWRQSLQHGQTEVSVTSQQLLDQARAVVSKERPAAFFAMVQLGRADDSNEPDVVLSGCQGPSAAAILGRFAHGDPAVERVIAEHVEAEERGIDGVVAEVVHLPVERLGNVIFRPLLRAYEIPCLGRSGAALAHQIRLSDLEVAVTRHGVVLRSRKLGKRVTPRLSNAHAFHNSDVTAYRFLCALQHHQASMHANWSWDGLANQPFLPRVRIDGVVVRRACWNPLATDLAPLTRAGTPSGRYEAARALKDGLNLPRFVEYGLHDVTGILDFDSSLSVDSFVHHAKRWRGSVSLTEVYPRPENQFIEGGDGTYAGQLCLAVVTRGRSHAAVSDEPGSRTAQAPRVFVPGSEWLYLKLYDGYDAADRRLVEQLAPEIHRLQHDGVVENWFFLRYRDRAPHLRIRLQGDGERLLAEALPRLTKAVANGVVTPAPWRIELGTYERELARYGGPEAMVWVESIFSADSEASVAVLRAVADDRVARWHMTLAGVHRLLADFGFDLDRALAVVARLEDFYARRFDPAKAAKDAFSRRFRAERTTIERLVQQPLPEPLERIFARRSANVAAAVEGLVALEASRTLWADLDGIVRSLLHMHANRMFRSSANAQEFAVYEFLRRTYRSMLGRRRRATKALGQPSTSARPGGDVEQEQAIPLRDS